MSTAADEPVSASAAGSRLTALACRLLILLATVLTVARLLQAEPLQSANDRSRWCTVRALVEQGTYRIDDVRRIPGWDTIDLVRHQEHFYSTKPPLLATLIAGIYWGGRTAFGWNMHDRLAETTRLILLLFNVLPMTVALLLFSRLVRRYAASASGELFITACACFGTLLSPFLVTLNNHTPAAVAVIFTLCAAVPVIVDRQRQWWRFALAGFWSAFTFTNELPAAAFVAALFGLLAWRAPRRTLLWFVPAAMLPVAAFFYTNLLATGGLSPFYAAYGSPEYEFVFEGVPSYWMQPRGVDKAPDSFPVYLLHCVIGHHGVLSLSPIFLFTLAGWGVAVRRLAARWRREGSAVLAAADLNWIHATGLALSAVVFAFFLTRTENYNYGGVSVALRWLLWLVPLWLLAMLPAMSGPCADASVAGTLRAPSKPNEGIPSCSRVRTAFGAATLAVSAFSAWYPWNNPWRQPWLFTLMESAGWIDYSDPKPVFDRPVWSWVHTVPESGPRQTEYFVELSGVDVDGRRITLRLADGGPGASGVRLIEVTQGREGEPDQTTTFAVDAAGFNAGDPPEQFLISPHRTSGATAAESPQAFWSGLPRPAQYVRAADRYLKLPLRTDAFHCIQAYAQVLVNDEETGVSTRFRRDAWFCGEIPFGVAQIETQVIDLQRQVLSRRRLTLSRFGAAVSQEPQPDANR